MLHGVCGSFTDFKLEACVFSVTLGFTGWRCQSEHQFAEREATGFLVAEADWTSGVHNLLIALIDGFEKFTTEGVQVFAFFDCLLSEVALAVLFASGENGFHAAAFFGGATAVVFTDLDAALCASCDVRWFRALCSAGFWLGAKQSEQCVFGFVAFSSDTTGGTSRDEFVFHGGVCLFRIGFLAAPYSDRSVGWS